MSEEALYVTGVEGLKHYEDKFSRIYFGNEFCQRLIPSERDLDRVLEFVSKKGIDFTYVTPYVTDEGLKVLGPLLRKISEEKPGSEVVFNDWGVLSVLKGNHDSLNPVMGRLLNRMKRGPRLMNLVDILPPSAMEYFRSSNLDVPLYRKFLIKNGVGRVELDNVLQGIGLDLSDSGISGSLYIPYAYITTTRFCLAISCDVHGKEDEVGIFPCKRECQKYTFHMRHPIMPVPLIRKGNTMFFKNDKITEGLESRNINRIVIEPEVPL